MQRCLKRLAAASLMAALALFSTGCVEGELLYTLNPDGSGKVVIDAVMPATANFFGAGAGDRSAPPDQQLEKLRKNLAKQIIQDSRGVDAWENVSVAFQKDGRVRFKGTAYFPDAAKLKIKTIPVPTPVLDKQAGKLRLTVKTDDDKPAPKRDDEKKLDPRKLTGKQLDAYVLLQRVKYQQGKGIMQAFLTGMTINAAFQLPGEVSNVQKGFQRGEENSVKLRLSGKAILAEMDRIMTKSDKELKAYVKEHGEILSSGSSPLPKDLSPLFESLSNASADVADPKGPLFDYSAAVSKARKAFPQLRRKLNLPDLKPPGDN